MGGRSSSANPPSIHYNPIAIVHAGLAMTLMDSAMGLAFVTTQDEPTPWTTLEVKSSFTRALTKDTGLVRCTGTIVHPGRRVTTTEARVEDAQGRLSRTGRARFSSSAADRATLSRCVATPKAPRCPR